MKLLEKTFTGNFDRVGDTVFTQLKKKEMSNHNVYIYSRVGMGKCSLAKYEVFIAKRRFKGQPLPGGRVEEEDREQYPTANHFGFTAKEVTTVQQADVVFNEFISKLKNKEMQSELEAIPGAKVGRRPDLVYPKSKQWYIKELLDINPEWTQSLIYSQVQKDIVAGTVTVIGRTKNPTGKGKPSVMYGHVSRTNYDSVPGECTKGE